MGRPRRSALLAPCLLGIVGLRSVTWLQQFQLPPTRGGIARRAEPERASYESSPAWTKSLVNGLTNLVNTAMGEADEPLAPARKFDKIASEQLLEGIQADFEERQYLWSGDIDPELYDEGCEFTDPTLSFKGLSQFQTNMRNLKPILDALVPKEQRRCKLREIKLKDGEVFAKWQMVGDLRLPWSPRIDITGKTRYSPGKDGRIESYFEQWDVSAGEALAQLVRPAPEEVIEHWPQQLAGKPPPKPAQMAHEDVPVVVLPGFGNEALDYSVPLGQDEAVGLKACLERRGLPVSVVPVKRADWIRVFVGILLDAESRAGNGTADGAYGWYLDLAKKAVEENTASTGKACVLVGHSAGGWLGRALMQREGREWAKQHVRGLVTLGTPHKPPPEGRMDMTFGCLRNLNKAHPGAYFSDDIFYVSVAGDAVVGEKMEGNIPIVELIQSPSPESTAWNSYQALGGCGNLTGDGLVPVDWAHLPGADQITIRGVMPRSSRSRSRRRSDSRSRDRREPRRRSSSRSPSRRRASPPRRASKSPPPAKRGNPKPAPAEQPELGKARIVAGAPLNTGEKTYQAEILVAREGVDALNHSGNVRTIACRGPSRQSHDDAEEDCRKFDEAARDGPKACRMMAQELQKTKKGVLALIVLSDRAAAAASLRFSMGVMFFEMWLGKLRGGLSSADRVKEVQELLPEAPPEAAKVLASLLATDPGERMTADHLLNRSGLLPSGAFDPQVQRVLGALEDPSSSESVALLQALFNRAEEPAKDASRGIRLEFADLVAPLSTKQFLEEYWGLKPFSGSLGEDVLTIISVGFHDGNMAECVGDCRKDDNSSFTEEEFEGFQADLNQRRSVILPFCFTSGAWDIKSAFMRDCAGYGNDAEVGMYFSRPGVEPAPWHFDPNHNVTIQIVGEKDWHYAPGNPHTIGGARGLRDAPMNFLDQSVDIPSTGPLERQCYSLKPGSVLYVPPGHWHSVLPVKGDCVSVNLRVANLLHAKLISEAVFATLAASARSQNTQYMVRPDDFAQGTAELQQQAALAVRELSSSLQRCRPPRCFPFQVEHSDGLRLGACLSYVSQQGFLATELNKNATVGVNPLVSILPKLRDADQLVIDLRSVSSLTGSDYLRFSLLCSATLLEPVMLLARRGKATVSRLQDAACSAL
ncbi:unnamed protein product [Effrenium voratum]|nr:unnamed protein product [Effrenium voratum]